MSYIVTLTHNGNRVPLRGTVWAYSMERAQIFATHEDAAAALEKARKFMKAAFFKKARIEEVPPASPEIGEQPPGT
jgi:hypothetical protein